MIGYSRVELGEGALQNPTIEYIQHLVCILRIGSISGAMNLPDKSLIVTRLRQCLLVSRIVMNKFDVIGKALCRSVISPKTGYLALQNSITKFQ